jgi:methionine biosynthesis protein MetW
MSRRVDHDVITSLVREGASVLDVGCGDGVLLQRLQREKRVRGRGLELSQAGVNACVAKGLSVVQGDASSDLALFPDASYDYVILSKTIQAVRDPQVVLRELVRIGRNAIVSIPNFGHWRARFQLLSRGRMPVTGSLPNSWHATENIHLCTVRDFADLVETLGIDVEQAVPIARDSAGAPFAKNLWRANWFAEDVVFLIRQPALQSAMA